MLSPFVFIKRTHMPLNCTCSSVSVDGTILSNAAKTLGDLQRRKHLRVANSDWHPRTQLCLRIFHQWITRKCLTLIMHVLCLHPTDLKHTDRPFLSQMSCFHWLDEFGTDIPGHFFLPVILWSVYCTGYS